MEKENESVTVNLKGQKIIYSFDDALRSYNKLQIKGKGTRDYQYLILVPRLYVGEKYCPDKRYSISFGMNKENNHQLVVIDLDDKKDLLSKK
jgi:hypothetical protein